MTPFTEKLLATVSEETRAELKRAVTASIAKRGQENTHFKEMLEELTDQALYVFGLEIRELSDADFETRPIQAMVILFMNECARRMRQRGDNVEITIHFL